MSERELSAERQELLELLLAEEGGQPLIFPLSYSQRGLWFLDQMEPGSPTYIQTMALRLRGRLDRAALARALNEVVSRHEALRATFTLADGEPAQVIAPVVEIPVPLVDLADLPAASRETEVLRLGAAEARRPFSLSQGPLMRATLLRLDDREHALLFALHHIVSDAWSLGVLIGEVSALYAAFAAGKPSPLPELPLQFPDYVEWQREFMQGPELTTQLAWWRDRLAGAPGLDLPTDRPRPAIQRPHVAQINLPEGPEGLAGRVRSLAQRHGATAFMVMLAAFQALLARYTGQDDLVVGTPIANRRFSDLEKLIGLFINTLALREDLSGDPTFSELLGRVRETTLGAYAHQDVPVEMLLAELRPERDLSRAPLYQVLFQVQNAPAAEVTLSDLTLEPVPLGIPLAGDYDMVITVMETPGGLAGTWVYNTDLFDRETIEHMAGHFLRLLDAACANPSLRLSELALADEQELRRVLGWGRPEPLPEIPGGGELRRLFEAQAARTPDIPALSWEHGEVSFSELNRRANRWAYLLREEGVGPETRVALAVERSPEMILGLLAVLKAGGAYVPLDPSYPAERLAFMIEDSGAELLLTHEHLGAAMSGMEARLPRVLFLDADPDPAAGRSEEDPRDGTGPEHAAYVIYTSGSTGRPKGVVAVNAGLANFARGMADLLGVRPGDRFPAFPSFSFDASLVSIASSLAAGATLILHPRMTEMSTAELMAFCAAQRATLVDLPVAFWREVMGELATGRPSSAPFSGAPLRGFMTGGESLSRDALVQWAGLAMSESGQGPESLFLSSYGPTETTVTTTAFTVRAGEISSLRRAVIPLGHPLPGVEVYVLDPGLQPSPIGVPGDVWIGGAGVTRGYLDRPDLTADAYRPDPLSGRPGDRFYRTGDRARWLPDGSLEFLGRGDAQVKIRGFRVELGEIEAALARQDSVTQAVVIVRDDLGAPGALADRRLVAYVVPAPGAVPEGEAPDRLTPELRARLRETLPEYMVPALFVYLERLPATRSGKVDRRALPRPEGTRAPEREYVAPRDGVEETLAGIWQNLLGVEKVGVFDNFFELGGHSLLGTRVIAALRESFGVEVPLRALFEHPTVADLALAVAQARVETSDSADVGDLLDQLEGLSDEEVEALLAGSGDGDEEAP